MSLLSQFFGGNSSEKTIPIEIFLVGGGAGSGGSVPGGNGGGGAGQVAYTRSNIPVGTAHTVVIGAGGGAPEGNGNSSTFFQYTAFGGGGGTSSTYGSSSGLPSPSPLNNSTGSIIPFFPTSSDSLGFISQNRGSLGRSAPQARGGGGGGAGGGYVGITSTNNGYDGIPGQYIGFATVFGGGGGGGGDAAGEGGAGGGGNGSSSFPSPLGTPGTNGTANSGGGGGGGISGNPFSGSGGSGTVIIRYPTAYNAAVAVGNTTVGYGGTHTTQSGYHVYKWNSGPGSITFS
jgi:hypothetical protein